jgi:poly(3-hydroxybutyrate) depolymerase
VFGPEVVDPRAVAATGFSNGGMLIEEAVARGDTLALGNAKGKAGGRIRGSTAAGQGLFAAIVPVGGHQHPATIPYHRNMSLNTLAPTPILMVHSADDGLVRFNGCGPGARCCCGIDDAVAEVGGREVHRQARNG